MPYGLHQNPGGKAALPKLVSPAIAQSSSSSPGMVENANATCQCKVGPTTVFRAYHRTGHPETAPSGDQGHLGSGATKQVKQAVSPASAATSVHLSPVEFLHGLLVKVIILDVNVQESVLDFEPGSSRCQGACTQPHLAFCGHRLVWMVYIGVSAPERHRMFDSKLCSGNSRPRMLEN